MRISDWSSDVCSSDLGAGFDEDPNAGLPVSEGLVGVGRRAGAQDSEERVVLQLLVGAVIGGRFRAALSCAVADESRSAPGAEGGSKDRVHPRGGVIVEHDLRVVLAALVHPCAKPNGRPPLRTPVTNGP